jgi:hypothetical protein
VRPVVPFSQKRKEQHKRTPSSKVTPLRSTKKKKKKKKKATKAGSEFGYSLVKPYCASPFLLFPGFQPRPIPTYPPTWSPFSPLKLFFFFSSSWWYWDLNLDLPLEPPACTLEALTFLSPGLL